MLHSFSVPRTCAADREDEPYGEGHEDIVRDHKSVDDSLLIEFPKFVQEVGDHLG